ncbi:hypothetical protein SHIRM173S_01654 [Streptomyces hirsutus]
MCGGRGAEMKAHDVHGAHGTHGAHGVHGAPGGACASERPQADGPRPAPSGQRAGPPVRCRRMPPERIAAASACAAPCAEGRRRRQWPATKSTWPGSGGSARSGIRHQPRRDHPARVHHHAESGAGRRDQAVETAAGADDPPLTALPLQRPQRELAGDARRWVHGSAAPDGRDRTRPLRADPHDSSCHTSSPGGSFGRRFADTRSSSPAASFSCSVPDSSTVSSRSTSGCSYRNRSRISGNRVRRSPPTPRTAAGRAAGCG